MRWFKRKRRTPGTPRTTRTLSFREMRAQMRTQRAEAKLLETEARIHKEAAQIRNEIGRSA